CGVVATAFRHVRATSSSPIVIAGPHCGVRLSGGGRIGITHGSPTIGDRVVSAASVEVARTIGSAANDHFTAGPHRGVFTASFRHFRAISSCQIIYALNSCYIKVGLSTNGFCFGVCSPTATQRTWSQDREECENGYAE